MPRAPRATPRAPRWPPSSPTPRQSGRDKLVIVTSPGLESFALWAEQLVAESLGKHGRGIAAGAGARTPRRSQDAWPDRAVAVVRLDEDEATRRPSSSAAAGVRTPP